VNAHPVEDRTDASLLLTGFVEVDAQILDLPLSGFEGIDEHGPRHLESLEFGLGLGGLPIGLAVLRERRLGLSSRGLGLSARLVTFGTEGVEGVVMGLTFVAKLGEPRAEGGELIGELRTVGPLGFDLSTEHLALVGESGKLGLVDLDGLFVGGTGLVVECSQAVALAAQGFDLLEGCVTVAAEGVELIGELGQVLAVRGMLLLELALRRVEPLLSLAAFGGQRIALVGDLLTLAFELVPPMLQFGDLVAQALEFPLALFDLLPELLACRLELSPVGLVLPAQALEFLLASFGLLPELLGCRPELPAQALEFLLVLLGLLPELLACRLEPCPVGLELLAQSGELGLMLVPLLLEVAPGLVGLAVSLLLPFGLMAFTLGLPAGAFTRVLYIDLSLDAVALVQFGLEPLEVAFHRLDLDPCRITVGEDTVMLLLDVDAAFEFGPARGELGLE
jgi:hypothetical protein